MNGASSTFTANQVVAADTRKPVNRLRPAIIRTTMATNTGATAVTNLKCEKTK